MRKKRSFLLSHLHIFNLPFVFILKFFGNVYVFKYKGFCQIFLKSDLFPSVQDFKDVDEWRDSREYAFLRLKNVFKFIDSNKFKGNIEGLKYSCDKIFLQHFFKDYEQYIFLVRLALDLDQNAVILGSAFGEYLKKTYPSLIEKHQRLDFPFNFLDASYQIFENKINLLKIAVKLFTIKNEKFKFKKFKFIFTGISAVEYPATDTSLNFAWPVVNGIVKAEDSLFVLDLEPNDKVKKYLDEKKIQYVTKNKLINSLPFFEKLNVLISPVLKSNFQYTSYVQNRIWYSLFKKLNPSHFVLSFSSGWPELHEVSIANALGIKTINWFYGTSEFGYTQNQSNFKDKSVRFCVRECNELWIWNSLLKDLIEERSFIPSDNKIHVIGPILNGDWSVLKESAASKKKFKIAFFDITPMNARRRLQYGEGPYCNFQMQNEIYQSVFKLLAAFPDIEILIKTKRAENPDIFESLPALVKLQESQDKRIQFLPPNANPYLAIKDADLVISTPYTSPSILALILGKKGLFYDPIGIAKHTYKEAFKNLTIYSDESLLEVISKFMKSELDIKALYDQKHFSIINVEQMEKNLKERLK